MKHHNKINIAFADDHVLVRKGIINLLSAITDFNFFIEADDGLELIKKIEQSKTKPDICLLDINMPNLDGFATLPELKKRCSETKVIALTTFEDEYFFTKMVRLGASGYVVKSTDPNELIRAINLVHSTGFYNPDLIAKKLRDSLDAKTKSHIAVTEIEKIFLKYCCSDLTYLEIAEKMKISIKSVEGHRDYLFKKLGVRSRVSLVMFAIQTGIFVIDR